MRFNSFEQLKSVEFPTATEKRYERVRSELLASIPSQEQGLNIKRMRDFFSKFDLKTPDLIVTDAEGLARARAIFEKNDYLATSDSYMHNVGTYLPEMQLALFNRGYQMDAEGTKIEDANGSGGLEGLIVHELAHGTGSLYGFRPDPETPYASRTGFWEKTDEGKDIGAFWEEGFAEYMRMRFLQETGAPLQEGVLIDDATGLRMPKRYGMMNGKKEPSVFDASLAGYALEHLASEDRALPEKLISARKSERGLKELIDFFESRWPGLYEEVQAIRPDAQGFRIGFGKIMEAVSRKEAA